MKITGITVGTTLPKSNFDQTDPSKGDYIKGDRSFLHPDSTLTQEGKSADAKATGEAIKNSVADWNQNDETALDYVKNRTHWTDNETTTLEWDGDWEKDGLVCFTFDGGYGSYYNYVKISDLTPKSEELHKNGEIVMHLDVDNINQSMSFNSFMERIEENVVEETDDGFFALYLVVAYVDGYTYELSGKSLVFPEAGVYLCHFVAGSSSMYLKSLSWDAETIHTLDQKYIPNADWNQNDPDGDGYVKNRPFYTDGLKETLVLEETVINIEDDGHLGLPWNITLIPGETYIVNFNGVKYECIAFTDSFDGYYDGVYLGNGIIFGNTYHTMPNNGEPFLIGCYVNSTSEIFATITGTHTLSIHLIQEKIHHIDSKYIKDMYYDSFQYIPYSGNVNFIIQNSWTVLPIMWPRIDGVDFIVTFDNVVYECPSRYRPSGSKYFGNGYLTDNELDDTGEPFILSEAEGGSIVINASPGIHDISIVAKLAYRNFIDDKYIPYNISRVGHTHPPSEIKNKYFILTDVETDSDYVVYIKNGNFASSLKCLGIEVKVPPIKTEYQRNELFDPTGMVVVAKYSGGNEEILNNKLFSSVTASYSGKIVLNYTDEIGITHTATHDKTSFALVDFEYIDNGNGTYTLTDWKQTLNGEPSTELIIPDNPNIIL